MFTTIQTKVSQVAANHPFAVAVLQTAGNWFILSAAISCGVTLGARVATAGMKPVSSQSSD